MAASRPRRVSSPDSVRASGGAGAWDGDLSNIGPRGPGSGQVVNSGGLLPGYLAGPPPSHIALPVISVTLLNDPGAEDPTQAANTPPTTPSDT